MCVLWVRPLSFGHPLRFSWAVAWWRGSFSLLPRLRCRSGVGFGLRGALGFAMSVSFAPASFSWSSSVAPAASVPALRPAAGVFALPPSLASLPAVSWSAAVSVVSVARSAVGVSLSCSDGRVRELRWSTVARYRGVGAASRARAFFATDACVGGSFRFVACGVDRTGVAWSVDRWFVAVVSC